MISGCLVSLLLGHPELLELEEKVDGLDVVDEDVPELVW